MISEFAKLTNIFLTSSLFTVYEKLKNNNSHLAKALSEEKQTSQTLFSQNVTLIGELQELRLACTTRDVGT